jgi:hypothetical protein
MTLCRPWRPAVSHPRLGAHRTPVHPRRRDPPRPHLARRPEPAGSFDQYGVDVSPRKSRITVAARGARLLNTARTCSTVARSSSPWSATPTTSPRDSHRISSGSASDTARQHIPARRLAVRARASDSGLGSLTAGPAKIRSAPRSADQRALLAAAQAGDERAFRQLVVPDVRFGVRPRVRRRIAVARFARLRWQSLGSGQGVASCFSLNANTMERVRPLGWKCT